MPYVPPTQMCLVWVCFMEIFIDKSEKQIKHECANARASTMTAEYFFIHFGVYSTAISISISFRWFMTEFVVELTDRNVNLFLCDIRVLNVGFMNKIVCESYRVGLIWRWMLLLVDELRGIQKVGNKQRAWSASGIQQNFSLDVYNACTRAFVIDKSLSLFWMSACTYEKEQFTGECSAVEWFSSRSSLSDMRIAKSIIYCVCLYVSHAIRTLTVRCLFIWFEYRWTQ